MKKSQKISLIILIIGVIYLALYNSYASGFGEIWNVGGNFLNSGSASQNQVNLDNAGVKYTIEQFVDFLWGIGLLIIFVTTITLGIRYMLVMPNEKSRIKQATTPWIIGVVIIFGAVTIWKFVIDILDGSL